ncbi:MAG: phosphoribosylamine--glycine ligase [Bacteroidota bacterium]|nr:phosphoribosylamine--glycine ligase [Bacteroidota bacterium]MDP4232012.1 phosphoribosylamine--glycine ligase [Bacteroidota bacterium]MDP4241281.1 phosphoribosylamine--glycine ligase [Bacteroidota bacterium]MDP4286673.1 phosphoribosylamine--glycine ligase [Bacteroidota bacterium]
MRILVLGGGAREHAIAWKLNQSEALGGRVQKIFCAPGNAGIAQVAELVEIIPTDAKAVVGFAMRERIDLVVIGPEGPLAMGVADALDKERIPVFGPRRNAALLESSKAFAKDFMHRHGIPTARYAVFSFEEQVECRAFLRHVNYPAVIKADGLAAGKGVMICETEAEATHALDEVFTHRIFGEAGSRIVVEEFMHGEEASVFAITDGADYDVLAPAQDHKRILDGDRGKNTGGMGAYAPAPIVTEEIMEQVKREIIEPTLKGLASESRLYRGVLYVGLMIANGRARVVEFNVRFGDPEAEVVIPLIDGDLAEILLAAAEGRLKDVLPIKQFPASAVTVVMASQGYPESYQTGEVISGLEDFTQKREIDEGTVVFHGATKVDDRGRFLTSGGRVLAVTAVGYEDDLRKTISQAYNAVSQISFNGAYYRSDIGAKALRAEAAV